MLPKLALGLLMVPFLPRLKERALLPGVLGYILAGVNPQAAGGDGPRGPRHGDRLPA